MFRFNKKHSAGIQGNAAVSHTDFMTAGKLQGKTSRLLPRRQGKGRRSRKMKNSIHTDSQNNLAPMYDQKKEKEVHPGKLSKKYQNTTINQEVIRHGKKFVDIQNNRKGIRAGNGDVQMSNSPLKSSEIMAGTRNAEQMKHCKSRVRGLKQDCRVADSQHIHQSYESSSDSVTAIGSPKSGRGLFDIRVDVNSSEEQLWNVDESDEVLGQGRKQMAEDRCSILKNDQNLSRSFMAEEDSAYGEKNKDRLLDELNSHVKKLEKCEPDRFADESRDAKDFLLSPARLCTFGLSEGAEVLKGVEKARQEMICEMEAMERNAEKESDSSVHEPKKGEDPEGWARWQEAKLLLKNIRKQERQLIGSGSSVQFTDKNLSADLTRIGADENMLECALDADVHVSSQDENMTGIYNMTFKNMAAGLLEIVRRRTGLNSSSDAQLHTDNTEDDGSQSRTDPSDLSLLSHDSGMVVEMNEEEGVTRWVDAVDAVTSQSTPSWKRIGRSKRISRSRSAQCAEITPGDVTESVKYLFADTSDNTVSKFQFEKSHDGQTKNIDAARPSSTPSWKRLGKRKRVARSMQSAGIVHGEIIDSVQTLFPAPPSEKQPAANIAIDGVPRDGPTALVPSSLTPTWKRIGRIKRTCRADKLAGNSQDDMVGFSHNLFLAPPTSHLHDPSISMSISSSLPSSRAFPTRMSVVCPSHGSLPNIVNSIPSPLPVTRSACKARPFSQSVGLSVLSTISNQSPSLDDPKMLSATSDTCTITASHAHVAIAQVINPSIAVKQGIKTSSPEQAKDYNDEIVKTPVQVLFCSILLVPI